ncbi:MAG: hypothetical protein WA795_02290, partial [Candidatus Sulfotelmatobacter sp.]
GSGLQQPDETAGRSRTHGEATRSRKITQQVATAMMKRSVAVKRAKFLRLDRRMAVTSGWQECEIS